MTEPKSILQHLLDGTLVKDKTMTPNLTNLLKRLRDEPEWKLSTRGYIELPEYEFSGEQRAVSLHNHTRARLLTVVSALEEQDALLREIEGKTSGEIQAIAWKRRGITAQLSAALDQEEQK